MPSYLPPQPQHRMSCVLVCICACKTVCWGGGGTYACACIKAAGSYKCGAITPPFTLCGVGARAIMLVGPKVREVICFLFAAVPFF